MYVTHNHFQAEVQNNLYEGHLPSRANGEPIDLSPQFLDDKSIKEAIPFEPLCHPYYKADRTPYLVMLKTLQQARYEGIWKPCTRLFYKWEGKIWEGEYPSHLAKWDFGVCRLSRTNGVEFHRNTMFPSLRVGELENGDVLAALGFSSIGMEQQRCEWDKSPDELWKVSFNC